MKLNIKMDKVLKGVGIVVAAGGLISAIFDNGGEDKELSKKIEDMQKRIDTLENK